ncbi:hypothetical protein ACP3V5_14580 [Vibrio maritimus]|jgi:hypothetical protein
MKIVFKSTIDNHTWETETHQLNSDILLRHFLSKAKTKDLHIDFSYCELTQCGVITDRHEQIIGHFSLLT